MARSRTFAATTYGVVVTLLAAAASGIVVAHTASGRGGLPAEWQLTLPIGALAAVLGWLLLRRRPEQRVGWVIAAVGASVLLQTSVTAYGAYSIHVHRLPVAAEVYLLARIPSASLIGLLSLLFLVFPTGTLPARGWRWVAALLALATAAALPGEIGTSPADTDLPQLANPLQVHSALVHRVDNVANIASVFVLLACAASVLVRWRRADAVVRRQIKVLLAAALLWPPVVLILVLGPKRFTDGTGGQLLFAMPVSLMLVAAYVAVLRYRLYDIDRVISRTVSYAVVTAVLGGTYVGVVTLTTRLLPFSSSVGVAASTLVVAAAFHPVRRRVQQVVDSRFNRARYQASRVVAGYSARLRDGLDLDSVGGLLIHAVADAVQPTNVSLWLAK